MASGHAQNERFCLQNKAEPRKYRGTATDITPGHGVAAILVRAWPALQGDWECWAKKDCSFRQVGVKWLNLQIIGLIESTCAELNFNESRQDHIELFGGKIRSSGGNNNNPTNS